MELIKAKIIETGEVGVLQKFFNDGEMLYLGAERIFGTDEVEELGPYEGLQPQPQQPDDPLAQLPLEMINKVVEMVDGYVERFDRLYWQRQRVEFVKLLMNHDRIDINVTDPSGITELADKYIQSLKNYE